LRTELENANSIIRQQSETLQLVIAERDQKQMQLEAYVGQQPPTARSIMERHLQSIRKLEEELTQSKQEKARVSAELSEAREVLLLLLLYYYY